MSQPYPNNPFSPGADDYLNLTWEMFGEVCRALALKVARDYRPDLVIGIARTGAIPGAIVASILRVDFHSITVSRKEGARRVRDRPAVLSSAPLEAHGRRVLLVDEIATSGETLRLALAAVRDVGPAEVRTATSFVRTQGYKPDYFALETDATVIFPWDRKIFDGDDLVVNPRYEGAVDD
ncbi:MAG: phosphoribosyltransferase [Gemmatimonadetes bacterium]|nr:MAG: phosphoribosyltransferase [Gemmatimonadota bacterium]